MPASARRVAEITERAMQGEIAFEPALRERVKLLAGLPESVIADVLERPHHAEPRRTRPCPDDARERRRMSPSSPGGFRQFTGAVRDRVGADEDRANTLAIEGGKLTGEVIEPILGHDAKLGALKEIAAAKRPRAQPRRSPSATAPMISRCFKPPASASPIAPSPRSPPAPTPASTTPTSPPCSTRRGFRARSLWRGDSLLLWEKLPRWASEGRPSFGRAMAPDEGFALKAPRPA